MSPRRVVGYVGEGRARRPLYHDDVIEGTPHGIPVGSPEAAAAIARVGGSETPLRRNHGLFPDRPALNSPEHLQKSRMNGARRHKEVVAAQRPAVIEEVPVSEPTIRSSNIPEDIPELPEHGPDDDPYLTLIAAANEARQAIAGERIALVAYEEAELRARHAQKALAAAWEIVATTVELDAMTVAARLQGDNEPLPGRVLATVEELPVPEPFVEEVRASVELDEHPDAVRTVKPSQVKRESPKPGGLTRRQAEVLAAVIAANGNLPAAARAMGVSRELVDVTLKAVGRKSLLPAELIPDLPASFAKYSTVPA